MGWRLPTQQELVSLLDPSQANSAGNPALPPNHPFEFDFGLFTLYWSATSDANDPGGAWFVGLDSTFTGVTPKTLNVGRAWCVRAGRGADAQ